MVNQGIFVLGNIVSMFESQNTLKLTTRKLFIGKLKDIIDLCTKANCLERKSIG
jgi:hypothetical protein